MQYIDGGICAPLGFSAWGEHVGIRPNRGKNDLAIIYSDTPCSAAGLFTRNRTQAAPVRISRESIADGCAQAICADSGNANACAPNDLAHARTMQADAAAALGLEPDAVLVASTGIIGQELPIDRVRAGIPAVVKGLTHEPEGSCEAANAILTTDTYKKEFACAMEIGGKTVRLGGISKGSGMIHPNMGTMLCFLTTDLAIEPAILRTALARVCDRSFHRISVDGDTSTNDTLLILANGRAGNPTITGEGPALETFEAALLELCTRLARLMAADGEGAHHLITCTVSGAASEADAVCMAKTVIGSTLTKCAIYANDANWGRVLCALGYAGAELDPDRVAVTFRSEAGEVQVCAGGRGLAFDEDLATRVLSEHEVVIEASVGDGDGTATCWGCDMTYDYVKINGSYRS